MNKQEWPLRHGTESRIEHINVALWDNKQKKRCSRWVAKITLNENKLTETSYAFTNYDRWRNYMYTYKWFEHPFNNHVSVIYQQQHEQDIIDGNPIPLMAHSRISKRGQGKKYEFNKAAIITFVDIDKPANLMLFDQHDYYVTQSFSYGKWADVPSKKGNQNPSWYVYWHNEFERARA